MREWRLRCLLREVDDLLYRMGFGEDLQRRINEELKVATQG